MIQSGQHDLKKIISRRDRRFDGRFFFGVSTTKIYCRPTCPAKPKPENILIFKSQSEAERNGYRPCKRCKPDLSPGCKLLDGTLNTVSRGLRIIENSVSEEISIVGLSDSLGVSERHLRRLFDEHLGASPVEIIITARLHFAKQLVESTRLPVAEIAFASGFQSIRRFNEAFKGRFHNSPSELRGRNAAEHSNGLLLKVPVRAPYDWDTVLAYLARHECYGTEQVDKGRYVRYVPCRKSFGLVNVSKEVGRGYLSVELINIPLTMIRGILLRIRDLFDTDHNPAHLTFEKNSQPAGIRVPGSFDPFEVAVSIILSQLVSTVQAKAKLKDLVKRFGDKIADYNVSEIYKFPSAEILSAAPIEVIGITGVKAGAIRGLSKAIHQGEINFGSHMDFNEGYEKLIRIKGVGEWTASMISMRCYGNPDAFPDSDLIIRRAIQAKLANPNDWSSSRAYLTHYLWHKYGEELSKINRNNKEDIWNIKFKDTPAR